MSVEPEKTDVKKVAEVWDGFAKKYGTDRRTSTPDAFLVDLEIRVLRKYIKDGISLLDIGCGNGYTSLELARKRNVEVTGIDISPELIKYANQLLEEQQGNLKGSAKFEVANVLDPDFQSGLSKTTYDVILTKRVIINILTWEEQKEAILKIKQLLKPGGIYLMIEATTQGHEKISRLRERYKMPRTAVRWHNCYLDEEKLYLFLREHFEKVSYRDFSSTYYIGSRFIQPLILKPFGKEPDYDFFMNRIFSRLPSIGNYGMQKLYVCRKGA
jgi:2-polyprenyl-3-methyl-5-hydroxy-6-metoxy-1,4-benzoquinol methylase